MIEEEETSEKEIEVSQDDGNNVNKVVSNNVDDLPQTEENVSKDGEDEESVSKENVEDGRESDGGDEEDIHSKESVLKCKYVFHKRIALERELSNKLKNVQKLWNC